MVAFYILFCVSCANDVGQIYSSLAEKNDSARLWLVADPQIGPADSDSGYERELELLLEKFVELANQEQPDVVIFNGDLVAFPKPNYFAGFEKAVKPLKMPIALVHGNHDGKYNDGLFLDLQEHLCGFRAPNYAFDIGTWRMVILCAPELLSPNGGFEEQLSWLENELHEAWRRPVVVFLHYHLLPVGLSQLEYYTYPKDKKNKLLDVLVRYGNVQYVFMGHVHNGVKASVRTAWEYQGTTFVVLPTLVNGRAFGEEYPQFNTNQDRGYFAEAEISQSKLKLYGRQLGCSAKYEFPERFPIFTRDMDPRAFEHWCKIANTPEIVNGDFENKSKGWFFPYRYQSEQESGFIWETKSCDQFSGTTALHLYTRYKGHAWQYDETMDVYQVLRVPNNNVKPTCKLQYYVPNNEKSFYGGGYIRIALFADTELRWMWVGHWGAREERVKHIPKIWNYHDEYPKKARTLDQYREQGIMVSMRLPDYGYRSHQISLNLPEIYQLINVDKSFDSLNFDTMLVMLGVWCGNEEGSFSGAWFDNITVDWQGNTNSTIDNKSISLEMFSLPLPYGKWYSMGHDK
ncbi:MAG TPA: metallophosphoesterase [Candidatus Hydrogenedens sp.]|nr:metallophosphoesterase [Candidatus Hydrogenedens sp.]HOL19250.1 metallophosphoesterase [Candidatus Hydrogenedens sp.]HPP58923.1 metallophosphoesterase [Candidatus Hydrogenedens sp.]